LRQPPNEIVEKPKFSDGAQGAAPDFEFESGWTVRRGLEGVRSTPQICEFCRYCVP